MIISYLKEQNIENYYAELLSPIYPGLQSQSN